MPGSNGQTIQGGPNTTTVNAGITNVAADNAFGQAVIAAGLPLHFWGTDGSIKFIIDPITGAIGAEVDPAFLPAPVSSFDTLDITFANGMLVATGTYTDDAGVSSTVTDQTPVDLSSLESPWNDQATGAVGNQSHVDIAMDRGAIRLGKYGVGTYDEAKPTRLAGFDAGGNLVEVADFCIEWTGTRAALLALRNTSKLIPGCVYTITDFSRGTLNNAVLIHTHAASRNKLFKDVAVETGWDVAPWFGTYDLDTARVIELHDNLQNIIKSDTGDEIETFPWGNARVTGNQFHDFDFNYNDSGARIDNNVGMPTGRLDVTGADTYVANCEFQAQADVDALLGAQIFRTTVQSNGRLLATGITVERCTIGSSAYFRSDGISLYTTVLEASTVFYGTGGVGRVVSCRFGRAYIDCRNCGEVNFESTTVDDYAKIYANAAASVTLNGCNAQSNGYFQAYPGKTLDASYSSVADNAYVRARDGELTVQNTHATSVGRIDHFATGANKVTHSSISSSGFMYMGETVTDALIDYSEVSAAGYLSIRGDSAAGTRIHRTRVQAGYAIINNSTGAKIYYSAVESGNSYISVVDCPGVLIYNAGMRSYGRLNVSAGRTGQLNGVDCSSTGLFNVSGGSGNISHCSNAAYFYHYVTNQTGGVKTGLHGYGRQTVTSGGGSQTGAATHNI